jgi:hypothetical protein
MNIKKISQILKTELHEIGDKYRGLCPFHHEDTPSFFVFKDGGYHCFGCGAHGEVSDLEDGTDGRFAPVDMENIPDKREEDLSKKKIYKYNLLLDELEDKDFDTKNESWTAFDNMCLKVKEMLENDEEGIRIEQFFENSFLEILDSAR